MKVCKRYKCFGNMDMTYTPEITESPEVFGVRFKCSECGYTLTQNWVLNKNDSAQIIKLKEEKALLVLNQTYGEWEYETREEYQKRLNEERINLVVPWEEI